MVEWLVGRVEVGEEYWDEEGSPLRGCVRSLRGVLCGMSTFTFVGVEVVIVRCRVAAGYIDEGQCKKDWMWCE